MLKTQALILKSQNWKETDRLITLFCPDFGKKRAIAKGARKPLSKLASHLDSLMVSQVILTDGELPIITSALMQKGFRNIRSSYLQTERALAITKLAERTALEDIDQRELYYLTLNALDFLNKDLNWQNIWLYFLFGLNDFLGLSTASTRCYQCNKSIYQKGWWDEEQRRFRCSYCFTSINAVFPVNPLTIKLFSLAIREPFDLILKVNLSEEVARQAEEILLKSTTQWLNKPWQYYAQLDRN